MSHASSAPLRMTEMRERHLSLKRSGARRSDAAAGRDGLLWSSPDAQGEPDKLLWMEGGVEKDTPELDEPTRTWLEESSEWTGSTAGAAGGTDSAGDGGDDPRTPHTSCGYETKGASRCLIPLAPPHALAPQGAFS